MTVLRLITQPELTTHREALCQWLRDNDVDPVRVSDRWISLELVAGERVIKYRDYKVTEDGRVIVDPDQPAVAWTEERTVPLVIDLDLPGPGDRHGL